MKYNPDAIMAIKEYDSGWVYERAFGKRLDCNNILFSPEFLQ